MLICPKDSLLHVVCILHLEQHVFEGHPDSTETTRHIDSGPILTGVFLVYILVLDGKAQCVPSRSNAYPQERD